MKQKTLAIETSIFDSATKTIIWSGLTAGILDSMAGLVAYYIYFELNPIQVMQFISTGIYGPSAINGGAIMTLIGMFFHFLIAFTVAIIYFFAYKRLSLLRDYKVVSGLLYGFGIWLIMNLIVIPASKVPPSEFDLGLAIVGIVWHMILVGLPIALITARYFQRKN